MKYMIHACKEREWYVSGYLMPSMMVQGIPYEDIIVYLDEERDGNLKAFLKSLELVKDMEGDTWHLQDDVAISKRFAELTRNGPHDIHGNKFEGVACGFCNTEYDRIPHIGVGNVGIMWWSFQCIRIPNYLAAEFLRWMESDLVHTNYKKELADGKHDDMFFKDFMCTEHHTENVCNIMPNLVEHVDYLIGGSVINRQRNIEKTTARYWEEPDVIKNLTNWIAKGAKQ